MYIPTTGTDEVDTVATKNRGMTGTYRSFISFSY